MVHTGWRLPVGHRGLRSGDPMIRIFGHYISRIFVGLGALEFVVLWLSLLAGYYIRIEARLEELVVPFSTISRFRNWRQWRGVTLPR